MLEAAYRLFCRDGYAATTMQRIADEAAVATQTLYFTFGTKGALLGEVLGAAIIGFERWMGPPREPIDAADVRTLRAYHAWFPAFEAAPRARAALTLFLDGSLESLRRGAALVAALHAAENDPDVSAVLTLGEQRRVETYGSVVRILAKKPPGLRPNLTARRATDVLLVLFGPATYRALAERGWSQREIRAWLGETLEERLFGATGVR